MNRIIQFSILVVLVFQIKNIDYTSSLDLGKIGFFLSLALGSFLSNAILVKRHPDTSQFSIGTLFLISFLVVHFQVLTDLYFGVISTSIKFIFPYPESLNYVSALSSLSLVAYFLGRSLNNKSFLKDKTSNQLIPKSHTGVSAILAFAWICLVIFVVTINKSYLFGGYGQYELGFTAGYMALFFESAILLLITIELKNLSQGVNLNNKMALFAKGIPIILYLSLVLISGDRGPILLLGIPYGFLWLKALNIQVTKIKLLGMLFVGSLFISFLGVLRATDDIEAAADLSSVGATSIYSESLSPSTTELAGSFRTLEMAVFVSPERFPHTSGLFFLQSVLLSVPTAKGAFISTFNIPRELTSSPQFLTFFSLGPDATWGVGTSCIADIYLDFGMEGVLLFMIFFGYLFSTFDKALFSPESFKPITVLLAVLYLGYSIYLPRGTLFYPLSKFVICLGLYYLNTLYEKEIFTPKSKRKLLVSEL